MVQVPEPKGHAGNQGVFPSLDHFQVELLPQLVLCGLVLEGHAVAQQVGYLLPHVKAEEGGCDLVIGRIHIHVGAPLHVIYDFLIAVDSRILALKVQFCVSCHLICLAAFVLIDRPPDKIHSGFFILTHSKQILICKQKITSPTAGYIAAGLPYVPCAAESSLQNSEYRPWRGRSP